MMIANIEPDDQVKTCGEERRIKFLKDKHFEIK